MISAACHHVIFFAIPRNMTSCTFMARSTAALEKELMSLMVSYSRRPQSGYFMC
jgi:hypothetical protein